MDIFFSNKLEILYQHLKENLFHMSSPFAKRWVVVHGPAMKSWLTWQMARDPDLGIAMGIEVIYSNQIFSRLLPDVSFPNFLELSLAIEVEIRRIMMAPGTLWQPIASYLKKEKRLTSLCQKLARLFSDYAKYGTEMIAKWENTPPSNWQQDLWQRLFCSDKSWSHLLRELSRSLPSLNRSCGIHFFSMSFLSKLEYEFLNRISQQISINYYLLSPCETFWSDTLSDRESRRLKNYWQNKKVSSGQLETLEELLRDKNPLLANFGRLGREMACQIEESNAQVMMSHEEPQRDSILHAIQSDMLTLRNPELDPVTYMEKDDTIQIHIASSALREIQILYDTILRLIDRHSEDTIPLYPSDFIVMAPNITDYEPHIRSVWDSCDSSLNCQIIDLKDPSQSLLAKGFRHLIDLGMGRRDASSLLELFEQEAFQRCHHLSHEDVSILREWIEQSGIRWGDDLSHRNRFLQQNFCSQEMVETSSTGTWDYGLTRILLGLMMIGSDSSLSHTPLERVDFSKSDLVGKWSTIIRSLREDLKPLYDGSELTLTDWCDYLSCLFRSYFSFDPADAGSTKDYDELLEYFINFKRASTHLIEEKFSFFSIKKHLEESLCQRTIGYRENHFHAVRFCSMVPLRAIPARVIIVIGMGEGIFPKQDHPSSLNFLAQNPHAYYCPSQSDYDRYLFLETVLSARDYFILSYLGSGNHDNKEQSPSILVTELISYLDKYYRIEENMFSSQCLYRHPVDSFDRKYFEESSPLKSYSSSAFSAAKAYYGEDKVDSHSFVTNFAIKIGDKNTHSLTLDIKNLSAAARHPVKSYLNKTLNLYLDKEEKRQIKTEEDIVLSGLNKYQLIQQSLKKPLDRVLFQANREGKLPLGAFKEVTEGRLKEDHGTILKQFNKYGFDSKSIFRIEFSKTCLKPDQVKENCWQLPSIKIRYKDSLDINIVGQIPLVSPQGMIILGKSSLGDMWKAWPQFLLFHYACSFHPNLLQKQLLFIHQSHSPKLLKSFFDDPMPHLNRYLDYYFTSMHSMSPMMPDWIPHIVSGDAEALEALMKKQLADPFASFQDDYTQWALNHDNLPDCKELISHWQPQAKELLSEMMEHWL